MFQKTPSRSTAILQALLVTVLWSSSWVLVKLGLNDIPPLTFAGLRYVWAFLLLLPAVLVSRTGRRQARQLAHRDWLRLILLGLIFYTATQGMVYVALAYLQAATLSLLLNFTTVLVAVLGVFWLREIPKPVQWLGILVYLGGALIYFYPFGGNEPVMGLVFGGIVVVANAISSLLGREINRTRAVSPLMVTVISMGAGSLTLLLLGLYLQGLPRLHWSSWIIISWLAIVNSAFAFTMWNRTQQTLSATESSIINNTMLIQIAVLAWVFLDERLTTGEIFGLVLAAVGILLVQLRSVNVARGFRLGKERMLRLKGRRT